MFEVGKKVICVKTHSKGVVKRGQILEVAAIRKAPCCGVLELDVRAVSLAPVHRCGICRKPYTANGIFWLSARLFAPLTDETPGEVTVEEVLEVIEVVKTYNERYLNAMRQMKDWGFYS